MVFFHVKIFKSTTNSFFKLMHHKLMLINYTQLVDKINFVRAAKLVILVGFKYFFTHSKALLSRQTDALFKPRLNQLWVVDSKLIREIGLK